MRKFVLLLVLLLALPAAAMADDSQFIEHEPFALDDSWVEAVSYTHLASAPAPIRRTLTACIPLC